MLAHTPVRCALAVFAIAAAAACGRSDVGPSPTVPRVTSIAPASGTTIGGTAITIKGANFTAAATVTIGGAPAAQVTLIDPTTITAVTAAHAAGAADVVVAVNGKTGSLPGGYTYMKPEQTTNAPPVVTSIVASGSRPNEPAQFADLDENLSVTAMVTDGETPVSQLVVQWSADAGTISGSGLNVIWTAPHSFVTPGPATITLTVTEHYQTTDDAGLPITKDNVTTATSRVSVHNSAKEIGDLASDFLVAFSQQRDVDYIVRNFVPDCDHLQERSDDICNQQEVTITGYTLGNPSTTVFSGPCPLQIVKAGSYAGDACAYVPAEWHSKILTAACHADLSPYIGKTQFVSGTDQVTAIVKNGEWKLCSSYADLPINTISAFKFRR